MQSWHYVDGVWHEENPPIVGPNSHALWLGSCVFDGARHFEGVSPDLDLHCARLVNSARAMGLEPQLSAGEIYDIALEGIARFPKDAAIYITQSPCIHCMKTLVSTGIRAIYFEKAYKLDTVADIVRHTGVQLRQVDLPAVVVREAPPNAAASAAPRGTR